MGWNNWRKWRNQGPCLQNDESVIIDVSDNGLAWTARRLRLQEGKSIGHTTGRPLECAGKIAVIGRENLLKYGIRQERRSLVLQSNTAQEVPANGILVADDELIMLESVCKILKQEEGWF